MTFDGRAVFGVLDPRKQTYVDQLKAGTGSNPGQDLYGQRRDGYLYAAIRISTNLPGQAAA